MDPMRSPTSSGSDTDVVVVGAGLAGLRCAIALRGAGLDVRVLEAADAPGGRIRTDVVDGFRADRGFQLLNPAYPAVGRWVDVPALRLQSFAAGVSARTDTGLTTLAHPLREPGLIAATAGAGARRPREVLATARWGRALLTPRRGRTLSQVLAQRGPDQDLGSALDDAGLGGLLRTVLERFFAGVLLEDELSTSSRYALLLTWMFVRGVPGLPYEGMQALPGQLADSLGARVRLSTPVESVVAAGAGVTVTAAGQQLHSRAVVVATGARQAQQLVGVTAPASKGVVTTWGSAPEAPTGSALLHVDGRARAGGPVVNCAVISNAAPSYAPPGRHLVQASALLDPGRAPREADVRRHAGEILGCSTAGWRELIRHEVPHALPAQPAPYSAQRPVALGDGVFVCGDHRDTGSIQGALVSGQRAADAVLASLAGREGHP
ncbi:MAG: FAD-dependent oxidoreductase [Nocardioides sp.]|nr:FAD-dependent oxidoreductase [Nocardioides sp.]